MLGTELEAGYNLMSIPGLGGGPSTSGLAGRAGKPQEQGEFEGSLGRWWEEPAAHRGWGKGTWVGESLCKGRATRRALVHLEPL